MMEWEASEWIGGNGVARPLVPSAGQPRVVFGPCQDLKFLYPGNWLAAMGGREQFVAALGPLDIVYIPFLFSATNRPAWNWETCKCHDYPEHVSLLREIAPKVAGILVGNMGAEFVGHEGAGQRFRADEAVELINRSADLVHDAGGRVWYGTVDWTLLLDAYWRSQIREAMLRADAQQVCFCGYCLSDACWWDRNGNWYGKQTAYQVLRAGKAPSDQLCQYLASAPIWTDVNGPLGLRNGNAKELQRMGFRGGVLDPLMD
jgi:hypothetical protein